MARLITSGFELNDALSPRTGGIDPHPNTGSSLSVSPVRTGGFALKVDQTAVIGTGAFLDFVGSNAATYFFRTYVNFASLGTGSGYTGVLGENAQQTGIALSAGVLKFTLPAGGLAAGSFTPSIGQWYRLEFSYQPSGGAWEWRVDGSTIGTGTGASVIVPTGLVVGSFSRSLPAPAYVANFDDAAVNDNTGAAQNSWPGAGSVVLLSPTADSAKGTGWTNDAASSVSLFPSVNNLPPLGIADTTAGGGGHLIRNAASSANSSYDATLTTYTAAGIGASDTVNVVVPIVATAAPVVTSAKAGTVGVVSNPAIANVALGAGGTAGAFWSGLAGGTYPTGWKWSTGTTTYAPTVTLSTAPVVRINQVTASTRIADVCAMGMYVDFTPDILLIPDLAQALIVT